MEQNESLELFGIVENILYRNEENGYTVLRVKDVDGQSVTVVGCFPVIGPGEELSAVGSWTCHPSYGNQFKAERGESYLPSTKDSIFSFLAGGTIKGIGSVTAALIVNEFGENALRVIESEPEKLASLRGISLKKAKDISDDFRRHIRLQHITEVICSYGIRPILALRLFRYYGDRALSMVRENPYILTLEHIGGLFGEADRMALESGMNPEGKNRVRAGILFELSHNSRNGHCFIPREKLETATQELIRVSSEIVSGAMDSLISDGLILTEVIAGCNACYLPELYEAETSVANFFCHSELAKRIPSDQVKRLSSQLSEITGFQCSEIQQIVVETVLNNNSTVITGGPGTGKTTSIRILLAVFDAIGFKTVLTAPTGRAAKRITEVTGRNAQTVHRLLEAKFDTEESHVVFNRCEDNPLDCDVVILDESSMVDILLMSSLLKALPEACRIILVGDANQLPSVGPGDVFSAIIRSHAVPVVELKEIFRQKADSSIVRNAYAILDGRRPSLNNNQIDFFRLYRTSEQQACETICDLFSSRLPGKMHISVSDIQVLTPTRIGGLGTAAINQALQARLNPKSDLKKEKAHGERVFREGDRVMQIRNNYDAVWKMQNTDCTGTGIFNGDTGVIVKIDDEFSQIVVDFDGRTVKVPFDNLGDLEHAWAITVHKSQGSEYPAVILALSKASPRLLERDILYTAVTRAQQLLILVGEDETVYRMVEQYSRRKRYNALKIRLQSGSSEKLGEHV